MSLFASTDCIDGKSLCGTCGGLVAILPGCAYPEGDVALFDELCAILAKSAIYGLEAEQLTLALDEALVAVGDGDALRLLTFWLPQLAGLLPLLAANPPRTRRACSMLRTVLQARARVRTSSVVNARGPLLHSHPAQQRR